MRGRKFERLQLPNRAGVLRFELPLGALLSLHLRWCEGKASTTTQHIKLLFSNIIHSNDSLTARTHAPVRVLQCLQHAHKSRRHILNLRIFSTLHADHGSTRVSLAGHLLVEPTPVSHLQGKTHAQPGTHFGSLFIVLGLFTPGMEVFAEVGRRPERLPGP